MLLTQLLYKTLIFDKTPRGKCFAVGISIKTKSVKYLFCRTEENLKTSSTEFILPIDAVASFSENALFLSRLRPILPKSCIKLTLGLPVYNSDGTFIGHVDNVHLHNYVASAIQLDNGVCCLFSDVTALSDAVILRKPQPYPIGQALPNQEDFVTKQTLRKAVSEQSLIQLTLSLPPFEYTLY